MPTFDLHIMKNNEFYLFARTFEVETFSCSRYARTPKLGRKPSYVYPIKYFIIRKFHGYSPEL